MRSYFILTALLLISSSIAKAGIPIYETTNFRYESINSSTIAFGHTEDKNQNLDFYLSVPGAYFSAPRVQPLDSNKCTPQSKTTCKPSFAAQLHFSIYTTNTQSLLGAIVLTLAEGSPLVQLTVNNETGRPLVLSLKTEGKLLETISLKPSGPETYATPIFIKNDQVNHIYGLYIAEKNLSPNSIKTLLTENTIQLTMQPGVSQSVIADLNGMQADVSQVRLIKNFIKQIAPFVLNSITTTDYKWNVADGQLTTDFYIITRSLVTDVANVPVWLTLYPHHDKSLKELIQQKDRVAGSLLFKLQSGNAFTTLYPYPGFLPWPVPLPEQDKDGLAALRQYIENWQQDYLNSQTETNTIEKLYEESQMLLLLQLDPAYQKLVQKIIKHNLSFLENNLIKLETVKKNYKDMGYLIDAFTNFLFSTKSSHLEMYSSVIGALQNSDVSSPFLNQWNAYAGHYHDGVFLPTAEALIKLGTLMSDQSLQQLGIYLYTTQLYSKMLSQSEQLNDPAKQLVHFTARAVAGASSISSEIFNPIPYAYNELRAQADYGVPVYDISSPDTPFYKVYQSKKRDTFTYVFDNIHNVKTIHFNEVKLVAQPGLNICTTKQNGQNCLPPLPAEVYPTTPQNLQWNDHSQQLCWLPSTVKKGKIINYLVEGFPVLGELTATVKNGIACTEPFDLKAAQIKANELGYRRITIAVAAQSDNELTSVPAIIELPQLKDNNEIQGPQDIAVPVDNLTQGSVWIYWYPPDDANYTYYYGFLPGNITDCNVMPRPFPLTTTMTNVYGSGGFFTPNTTYTFCVYAQDSEGNQSTASGVQFTTPTGIDVPTLGYYSYYDTSIEVPFYQPKDTNPKPAPFTYTVEAYQDGIPVPGTLQTDVKRSPAKITGLSPATQYSVKVTAQDKYGYESLPVSTPQQFTQGCTPPTNAIADPNAVIFDTFTDTATATVSWTGSTCYSGNSSLTAATYTVTTQPQTFSNSTSLTTTTLTLLNPDTTYNITIKASLPFNEYPNPLPATTSLKIINPIPLAPPVFQVCGNSSDGIILRWLQGTDPTPNNQGGVITYNIHNSGALIRNGFNVTCVNSADPLVCTFVVSDPSKYDVNQYTIESMDLFGKSTFTMGTWYNDCPEIVDY